jgi:hypothetical protein
VDLEGLVFWNFGVLEVAKGAFDSCNYLFVLCIHLNELKACALI